MIEEKEEALRQISEIKNHLVDKQTFFPYNYRALYVWSIIASILTLVSIYMYEESILQGSIFIFVSITIGFIIEGLLTKKENKAYDIEACTHKQQFIVKSFFMVSLFLIVLSAVLASYKLYVVIFIMWLFLISLVDLAVGFVVNIRHFTQMAMFNMLAATVLLFIGFINEALVGIGHTYLTVVQVVMILGLTVMPAALAWQQLKEGQ